MGAQFRGIVEEGQRAVDMDGEIVPRRNNFAVLLLGRIPRGRDVGIWSEKYRQRLNVRLHPLPLRIGAGKMAEHRSERRWFWIEQQRQMARLQLLSARRDQSAEAILSDGIVQYRNPIFLEVLRNVHVLSGRCARAHVLSVARRV